MSRVWLAAVAVAVFAAVSARAEPATAPVDPEATVVGQVTVQGRRATLPETVLKRLPVATAQFVDAHGAPGPWGNLARWRDPACPVVIGVSRAFGEFINKRISELADQVGAPSARQCRKMSVLVVFTTEPQQFMDNVRKQRPWLLGYHYLTDEKALATFHGPVDAWHKTGTRGRNGALYVDTPYAEGDPELGVGPIGQANSRFQNGLFTEFTFTLVVVDAGQLDGQPIGPFADQIAMLALADPGRPHRCSPLPSILDAFAADCPAGRSVDRLTVYDRAYLEGLYSSNPQQRLAGQRRAVDSRVLEEARQHPPSGD